MWAAIFLLAAGTFVVGTSELVIAGVLPIIAADLEVSVALAAYLVTAYALAFAIVTPLVALTTAHLPRRPMLLLCLAIFVVGNAAAALAPSFAWLIVARVVVAAASGVFEVVATATAAALVPAHQRGRAIAVVVGGFSVALLIGVPAGTLIGAALGWRASFAALMGLGFVAAAGLVFLLPPVTSLDGSRETRPWGLLSDRRVLVTLAVTALVFIGLDVPMTFIAVILQDISGLSQTAVAGVLLLLGLASLAGNALGGLGSDRLGVRRTALVSGVGLSLGLVGVAWLGPLPVGAVTACVVLGVCVGILVPAEQARLVGLAPRAPDFGLAMNLAALNIGIASGAALGSSLVERGGLMVLGYVGALIVLLAVTLVAAAT